ncbi:MAG: CoA pyrophosphatase [Candidatus Sericytochromatia bacterium]|nr:CoA pyrophosphatase [Candidatus Sericytochromatia bacterium]
MNARGPDLSRLLPLDALSSGTGREAAVLVPVCRTSSGDGTFVLRRTMAVPTHKGEFCFPGGGRSPEDPHLLATALRELGEETGIQAEHVTPLGLLPTVETLYGIRVQPIVAELFSPWPARPDGREVDLVLDCPWHVLEAPETRQWRTLAQLKPHHPELPEAQRLLPAYVLGPHTIWGLTARILDMLLFPGAPAIPLPRSPAGMPPWGP